MHIYKCHKCEEQVKKIEKCFHTIVFTFEKYVKKINSILYLQYIYMLYKIMFWKNSGVVRLDTVISRKVR